jgi:ATP-binding cassette subfamily F protein uup
LSKYSKNSESLTNSVKPAGKEKKPGLSFNEKREFELLSREIEDLESEKIFLESEMSMGVLGPEELYQKSIRHGELVKLLDDKEMRWLELSEK